MSSATSTPSPLGAQAIILYPTVRASFPPNSVVVVHSASSILNRGLFIVLSHRFVSAVVVMPLVATPMSSSLIAARCGVAVWKR